MALLPKVAVPSNFLGITIKKRVLDCFQIYRIEQEIFDWMSLYPLDPRSFAQVGSSEPGECALPETLVCQ